MSALFPKWTNILPTLGALAGGPATLLVVGGFWYFATPKFWEVGYMPTQPGSGFNHQIHAGKLGMDCRYCHTNVETSPEANVPTVAVCYGCHADGRLGIQNVSATPAKVQFIRDAAENDTAIEWRRVHKLPDYVRNFPHHVHVNAGVSCYSCHGQITAMPVVYQEEPLSMSWCLDCHRNPEQFLVEPDMVTQLVWVQEHLEDRAPNSTEAQALVDSLRNAPPQNCGACHH